MWILNSFNQIFVLLIWIQICLVEVLKAMLSHLFDRIFKFFNILQWLHSSFIPFVNIFIMSNNLMLSVSQQQALCTNLLVTIFAIHVTQRSMYWAVHKLRFDRSQIKNCIVHGNTRYSFISLLFSISRALDSSFTWVKISDTFSAVCMSTF